MLPTANCPVLDMRPRLRVQRAPTAHRAVPKRRQIVQERIRPEAKKRQRVRAHVHRNPKPAKVRYLTGSEQEFASWLRRYCIEFVTQNKVETIDLDLEGKGMTRFQPDFYLLCFGVYVEVTEGKSERLLAKKWAKIHAAERAGKSVVLVTARELRSLRDGEVDLFDLIDPSGTWPRPETPTIQPTVYTKAGRLEQPQQPPKRATSSPRPRINLVTQALEEGGIDWRYERRSYPLSDQSTLRPDLYLPELGLNLIVTSSTRECDLLQRTRQIELLAEEYNRDCMLIGPEELNAIKLGQFSLGQLLVHAA
jgi:hypothetical protein